MQLLAFVVLSIGLLGVVRPRMLHLIGRQIPRGMLTNQGIKPDRAGVVAETVSSTSGMIRLGNAEFWTARAYHAGAVLAPGTPVRVVYVDGLTAYVEPQESVTPDAGISSAIQENPVLGAASTTGDVVAEVGSPVREESIS